MIPCPACDSKDTRVTSSDHDKDAKGNPITRRYKRCLSCDHRFSTVEVLISKRKPGPKRGSTHKGKGPHGERNHASVLTERDVLRLRRLAAQGVPNVDIAKQFGLAAGTVSRIVNRHSWKHI